MGTIKRVYDDLPKRMIVIFLIIGGLTGYIFGYMIGSMQSLNWCVDTGLHFLELRNISVDVNQNMLRGAINLYENHITNYVNTVG